MKEFLIESEKENFIGAWFIDEKVCDLIVEYFNKNIDKAEKGTTIGGVDENFKKSTDYYLNGDAALTDLYCYELQKATNEYIKKFPYCNDASAWNIQEALNIQKYDVGGHYKSWHTERACAETPFSIRHLVFLTYLNDVNIDGETEFFHQKVKVKPRKGLTLIWPGDWTYTHRGNPTGEEKYIITGWFSYKLLGT